MKIHYVGHSSFLITTSAGTRILTDPFLPAPGRLDYAPFAEPVNIVTVSHEHSDHGSINQVNGAPVVIRGDGKFGAEEVDFLGVGTFHDEQRGAERGRNTVFVISADGLRIAHMGDLGHVLTADQAAEIGDVCVALIPVGGYYTINPEQATKVAEQIAANIVIPMHYRTAKCRFPIVEVDEFLAGKPNVVRAGGPEIEVSADNLPDQQQIIVLEPSG